MESYDEIPYPLGMIQHASDEWLGNFWAKLVNILFLPEKTES